MLGFTKAVTWFLGNEALNTIDHMLFAKMNSNLMHYFDNGFCVSDAWHCTFKIGSYRVNYHDHIYLNISCHLAG